MPPLGAPTPPCHQIFKNRGPVPDPHIFSNILGYLEANRPFHQLRLKISCSGSRSKLNLEPYRSQSGPKPCFGKVRLFCQDWSLPRSHAMQAILDFAGQKTHVLRGRLPPAVFFQEKSNPQILDMPTRPNFQRFLVSF